MRLRWSEPCPIPPSFDIEHITKDGELEIKIEEEIPRKLGHT